MPGKNSPGYRAAYARAERIAAKLWRLSHPTQWRELLAEELSRRTEPEGPPCTPD